MARAWVDPSFKQRLLDDANAAAAELGITATNSTTATKLKVGLSALVAEFVSVPRHPQR